MRMSKRLIAVAPVMLALSLGTVGLAGCDEGPAEKAGKQVDEAAKDAKRAVQDATD